MRDRAIDYIDAKYSEVLKTHRGSRSPTIKEKCEDEMSILLYIRKILKRLEYDG